MTRALPALLVASGALLLLPGPCGSAGAMSDPGVPGVRPGEAEALALLATAAVSARSRGWSGTQYVSSWHGDTATSRLVDVHHDPAVGLRARPAPVPPPRTTGEERSSADLDSLPATAPDERLLPLLRAHYALRLAPDGTCAGRRARVVEARRLDGQVAGRFWLDRDSGLPLRREVYDSAGRRLRSTAFVDLQVAPMTPAAAGLAAGRASSAPADPAPDVAPAAGLAELPGGFTLFDERPVWHEGARLLAQTYSDGLSTLSVFRQPGELGQDRYAGYAPYVVDGSTVWARSGAQEQVVWAGADEVFTVVSDAGLPATLAAVAALPRDRDPDEGLTARLGRGLARVGSWVNPFG